MQEKPQTRVLTPAAARALAEAQARRRAEAEKRAAQGADTVPEIDGPKGPDPVRYGDWEKAGIASDF